MAFSVLLAVLLFTGMKASLTDADCTNPSALLTKSSTFTASSGNPVSPILGLADSQPWIPVVTKASDDYHLIVDIGQAAVVTGFQFAGDPKQSHAPSQIKVFYRNGNGPFVLVPTNDGSSTFDSSTPPPVAGKAITKIALANPVVATSFKFEPQEPNPFYANYKGGASLRVQLHGCPL